MKLFQHLETLSVTTQLVVKDRFQPIEVKTFISRIQYDKID